MISRQLAWTALAAIIPSPAGAQTIQDTNLHAWFMYFGDHPVNDRWGIHLESQVRRANAGLTWQQLLIRPGINYQLTKNVMLTAGYAYVRTSSYGDVPAKTAFPEHRVFEQPLIKHGAGKVALAEVRRVRAIRLDFSVLSGSKWLCLQQWIPESRCSVDQPS